MDEKVNDALLAFVDFLYAVMFGLIVAKIFVGWGAVLIYELAIRRRPGIQAGPGVPFIPL